MSNVSNLALQNNPCSIGTQFLAEQSNEFGLRIVIMWRRRWLRHQRLTWFTFAVWVLGHGWSLFDPMACCMD